MSSCHCKKISKKSSGEAAKKNLCATASFCYERFSVCLLKIKNPSWKACPLWGKNLKPKQCWNNCNVQSNRRPTKYTQNNAYISQISCVLVQKRIYFSGQMYIIQVIFDIFHTRKYKLEILWMYDWNNKKCVDFYMNCGLAGRPALFQMWVFLEMVVPAKHTKMMIFSRKTNGCWVPPF